MRRCCCTLILFYSCDLSHLVVSPTYFTYIRTVNGQINDLSSSLPPSRSPSCSLDAPDSTQCTCALSTREGLGIFVILKARELHLAHRPCSSFETPCRLAAAADRPAGLMASSVARSICACVAPVFWVRFHSDDDLVLSGRMTKLEAFLCLQMFSPSSRILSLRLMPRPCFP